MATHSSIFLWKIPWTEQPGGLQFVGSQRVRHDYSTKPPPPPQEHSYDDKESGNTFFFLIESGEKKQRCTEHMLATSFFVQE